MDINREYWKNLTDPDYRQEFGYPDRVGELAEILLADDHDEEALTELYDTIFTIQAEWFDTEEVEDEHEAS